jgi:hypothetical protein
VLQETVNNCFQETIHDYRILAGVALPQFREALMALIGGLTHLQVVEAIASRPFLELWPKAIEIYSRSGNWRGSEERFRELITPFAGHLTGSQLDQLTDAIVGNGQNWDAAETDTLLLALLRNTTVTSLPTPAARDRFYHHARRMRRLEKYNDVITLLQVDGWNPPPPEAADDD